MLEPRTTHSHKDTNCQFLWSVAHRGCVHNWATVLRAAMAPERRVGWHPAVSWEQQSKVCLSPQPLAVTKTQNEVLLTGTGDTPQENCSGGELQEPVGSKHTEMEMV